MSLSTVVGFVVGCANKLPVMILFAIDMGEDVVCMNTNVSHNQIFSGNTSYSHIMWCVLMDETKKIKCIFDISKHGDISVNLSFIFKREKNKVLSSMSGSVVQKQDTVK